MAWLFIIPLLVLFSFSHLAFACYDSAYTPQVAHLSKVALGDNDKACVTFPYLGKYSAPASNLPLYHAGIDLRANYVPTYSIVNGTVKSTGISLGQVMIEVNHNGSIIKVFYLHLSSFNVSPGDQVNVGDLIGITGEAGSEGFPHLHIEVRHNYSGTSAVGRISCSGTCDTQAKVAALTIAPEEVVASEEESLAFQCKNEDYTGDWGETVREYANPYGIIFQNQAIDYCLIDTRYNFIAILIRALEHSSLGNKGILGYSSIPFTDLNEPAWLQGTTEIHKAYQLGIVSDQANNLFSPNRDITRIEALAFTVRTYENYCGNIDANTSPFVDRDETPSFMQEYIDKGFAQGLTSGYAVDGERYFKPNKTVTRYESVAFVDKLIRTLESCSILPQEQISVPNPVTNEDKSVLLGETYEDNVSVDSNQIFNKQWTLKNIGTTTWDSNYHLEYVSGNLSTDQSSRMVSNTVPPNGSFTFTVPMQAPQAQISTQSYREDWKFVNPNGETIKVGNMFTVWAKIQVANNGLSLNDSSVPSPIVEASILFRESDHDAFFGRLGNYIPGFDHTGLNFNDVVYESHPGYTSNHYSHYESVIFQDEDDNEVVIFSDDGVQFQHTKGSFSIDLPIDEEIAEELGYTGVGEFEEIAIPLDLASDMKDHIITKEESEFQYLNMGSGLSERLSALSNGLLPEKQKGGDNTFTCVGLIEWAAEQAGHQSGQGFIKNHFESVTVPMPVIQQDTMNLPFIGETDVPTVTTEDRTFGLLSPELLYQFLKFPERVNDAKEWLQGLFDPVDFIITDPLGRRLGYTELGGELNEIPNAFYSGDGYFEQFLIPNPIPGEYTIELVGLGEDMIAVFGDSVHSDGTAGFMSKGEVKTFTFIIGDWNDDGNADGDTNDNVDSNIDNNTGNDIDDNVDGKVTICHKGKKTLNLPEVAFKAHLGHGDTIGACGETEVTLCHNNKITKAFSSSQTSTIIAHINHGDREGACQLTVSAIDDNSNVLEVDTEMTGGIVTGEDEYQQKLTVRLGDSVIVQGTIKPDTQHIGKRADIVVMGLYTPDPADNSCDPQNGDYYMNAGGENTYCTWIKDGEESGKWCNPNATRKNTKAYQGRWNGSLKNLAPLYTLTLSEEVELTAKQGRVLYKDNPTYTGHVCINFGYRVHDDSCAPEDETCCAQSDKNCALIFNSETVNLSVEE